MASSTIIEDALTITGNNPELLWKVAFANGATEVGTVTKLGNDSFILEGQQTLYCNATQVIYLAPAAQSN